MSKRLNEKFLVSYLELERAVSAAFSNASVSEYVSRLQPLAKRSFELDALKMLRELSDLRAGLLGGADAKKGRAPTRRDLRKMAGFTALVRLERDPLSRRLKKQAGARRMKRILSICAAALIVLLSILLAITVMLLR